MTRGVGRKHFSQKGEGHHDDSKQSAPRGMATAFMLVGLATGAQGQVAGSGVGAFGGLGARGLMEIRGKVVCTSCDLVQARQLQPDGRDLLQLNPTTHSQTPLVIQVTGMNHSRMWQLPNPYTMQVRAKDSVFEQLVLAASTQEHVALIGLLRRERNLDLAHVSTIQ